MGWFGRRRGRRREGVLRSGDERDFDWLGRGGDVVRGAGLGDADELRERAHELDVLG
jgi:hypothetical protein